METPPPGYISIREFTEKIKMSSKYVQKLLYGQKYSRSGYKKNIPPKLKESKHFMRDTKTGRVWIKESIMVIRGKVIDTNGISNSDSNVSFN